MKIHPAGVAWNKNLPDEEVRVAYLSLKKYFYGGILIGRPSSLRHKQEVYR